MRIEGTGYAIIDGIVQTPEEEEKRFQKALKAAERG
jgi:hypothetical protein